MIIWRCQIPFLTSLSNSQRKTMHMPKFACNFICIIRKQINHVISPLEVSNFSFDNFFVPFPVSFMRNVRAVFGKLIISGEKTEKYWKSKNGATTQRTLKSYIMTEIMRKSYVPIPTYLTCRSQPSNKNRPKLLFWNSKILSRKLQMIQGPKCLILTFRGHITSEKIISIFLESPLNFVLYDI